MRHNSPTRQVLNMAAEVEKVNSEMDSLHINDISVTNQEQNGIEDNDLGMGFNVEELYRLAVAFYKGEHDLFTMLSAILFFF